MRPIWIALALLMATTLGCSSSDCTNVTRAACDDDAGMACPTHQSCIATQDAVDPCPSSATGCCFQVCTADTDCPDGMLCTNGACAQGRCVQ